MRNNLFTYATKELSQDAILCWLINWLNYPDTPQYRVGLDTLNLFLGNSRMDNYTHVEVKRQYKKIDVLILFNDCYALIIEDKTNTSEHSDQIARYREIISKEFPNRTVLVSYVKTGIIYDDDARVIEKADTVVTLDDLLGTLLPFKGAVDSQILDDFVEHLEEKAEERRIIDEWIAKNKLLKAVETAYGQFSFMDQMFPDRSKGTPIGKKFVDKEKNPNIYNDYIYAGTNNGGTPWTQYCFWAQEYPEQLLHGNEVEYHYLFWRLDCNWKRKDENDSDNENDLNNENDPDNGYETVYYIALRHYDENTKKNEAAKKRKIEAYRPLRKKCDAIRKEKYNDIAKEIGTRENYKESDLIFIPLSNFENKSLDEIRLILDDITQSVLSQI